MNGWHTSHDVYDVYSDEAHDKQKGTVTEQCIVVCEINTPQTRRHNISTNKIVVHIFAMRLNRHTSKQTNIALRIALNIHERKERAYVAHLCSRIYASAWRRHENDSVYGLFNVLYANECIVCSPFTQTPRNQLGTAPSRRSRAHINSDGCSGLTATPENPEHKHKHKQMRYLYTCTQT